MGLSAFNLARARAKQAMEAKTAEQEAKPAESEKTEVKPKSKKTDAEKLKKGN